MKIGAEFLKKQEEALTFLLVKPSAKFTSNDFHQLRLEIKKLNAFLDLVNFCSNDFNRKMTMCQLLPSLKSYRKEEIKRDKLGGIIWDF